MHTINGFGLLKSSEKQVLQTTPSKFSIMPCHVMINLPNFR